MSGMGSRVLMILLGVIIGLCLLSTVGGWIYVQIAGVPVEVPHTLPPEAIVRQNPFYAAERFLTKRGIETESASTLTAVKLKQPSTFDLLLLLDDRRPLPQSRVARLQAWIEAGGHLICAAPAPDADEAPVQDPLLAKFDIESTFSYSWSETVVEDAELGPLGEALDAEFIEERGLIVPFNVGDFDWVWTGADGTIHGLSLPAGEGRLTVLSDTQLWKNPGMRDDAFMGFGTDRGDISNDDHARLLWELSSEFSVPSSAVLVYDDTYPGLWSLLLATAWPFLISLAVLITVWLLGASRRFGPLLLPIVHARRSLLEHLEAAGFFMWRQDGQKPLIEASRDALRAKIRRRRAHLAHLPDEELANALANDLGMPRQDVHQALCAPIPRRAEPFTLLVAYVERLRRAL